VKKSRFSESQIVGVLKEHEAGTPTKDLCRRHGISPATFYAWKAKFGGMEISDVAKMRALEDENRRLKRIVADQALHIDTLKIATSGKLLTPVQKRRVVQAPQEQLDISERQACRYIRANRRMIRYVRIPNDDVPLRTRLEELAAERRRFGYRRLAGLLRRDGWKVNIKRVLRVYREAHLQVRKRLKRRVAIGRGDLAAAAVSMNERWSLDFVHDTLGTGRRIRALNIVDDFTRECLAIEVDTSLSGQRVARVLDAVGSARGFPQPIVMYHGTELTSIAMACWVAIGRCVFTSSSPIRRHKMCMSNHSTAVFVTNAWTSTSSPRLATLA
jgi:putative transposase